MYMPASPALQGADKQIRVQDRHQRQQLSSAGLPRGRFLRSLCVFLLLKKKALGTCAWSQKSLDDRSSGVALNLHFAMRQELWLGEKVAGKVSSACAALYPHFAVCVEFLLGTRASMNPCLGRAMLTPRWSSLAPNRRNERHVFVCIRDAVHTYICMIG